MFLFVPLDPRWKSPLVNGSVSRIPTVLVDSGADTSLMDADLARDLFLNSVCLSKPLEAIGLNGKLLWRVTHRTPLCQ